MATRTRSRAKLAMLNDRDLEIFCFIWKWKVSPTSAIHHRFFKGCTSDPAYRRLCKLQKAGWLELISDPYSHWHAWSLTAKSFRLIRDRLAPLKVEGYRSNFPYHDLQVMMINLGEWVGGEPEGVNLFTEQEIRCWENVYHPTWYPTNLDRRPDGTWFMGWRQPVRRVALEVELSRKTAFEYADIIDAYAAQRNITNVIWVAGDIYIENALKAAIGRRFGERSEKFLILRFRDVIQNGWDAVFIDEELSRLTLRQVLHHCPVTASPKVSTPWLFHSAKSFPISAGSKMSEDPSNLSIYMHSALFEHNHKMALRSSTLGAAQTS
jgi:hypothetical protein